MNNSGDALRTALFGRPRMQIDYLAHHDYFVTELARWHFAQWSHLWSGDTVEARTKRLRQRCGSGGLPCVFVAFDGPALFGSATLVQYDFSDRPNLEAWLINLYVTPSMRRQGIGAALVSAVEEEARRSNVS
jgi:GNAT superfamily N-acetyltransferase